jgi:Recombination endonuclease VII
VRPSPTSHRGAATLREASRCGPVTAPAIDQHATCQHIAHRLTCQEFSALLERSGGRCELCGRADIRLWIDHAHTTGLAYGPVRGLLCPKCNAHMRHVDSGQRPVDARTAAFLALRDYIDQPDPQ